MRVAIIGGRGWRDYLTFQQLLDDTLARHDITVTAVVSGGAEGADTFAEIWAWMERIPVDVHLPDWRGARARNFDIVRDAELVIAFPLGRSPGTRDAIRQARALSRPVIVVG